MHKPKNWGAFNKLMLKDPPKQHIVEVAKAMVDARHNVIIVSAREETYRPRIVQWLRYQSIEFDALYLRKEKDYREDSLIKEEILQEIIRDFGKKPDLVFDDRARVVEMWRRNGVNCAQVEKGNF
jgi:hypothetical protein